MKNLALYAVIISAAIVFLAGCGGSQPPVGAPFGPSATQPVTERTRTTVTYSVLYSFKGGSDGAWPQGGLLDVNGVLYGTTPLGGLRGAHHARQRCGAHILIPGCGTVFAVTLSGAETVLHRFVGARKGDGATPYADLIDVQGTLYGTTYTGGTNRHGSVFAINASGEEGVLYSFRGGSGDGASPLAGLISVNGTLYGTTRYGGAHNAGTVFAIAPSGQEHVLHTFGSKGDGTEPFAGLIKVKGALYGTTLVGGVYNNGGTAFAITLSGKERVLHSFGGTADGAGPNTALVNIGGKLYGTTGGGGVTNNGTVFSITTSGNETVLHSFRCSREGFGPKGPLASINGTLYGTTVYGVPCSGGDGTVYAIDKSGKERVLHQFSGPPDGAGPYGGVINVNGTLYGTTLGGGGNGYGTVFALTP